MMCLSHRGDKLRITHEIADSSLVILNVYRMNDSDLGFYHSGLLYHSKEYTYCQDLGIINHEPRLCTYSTYLGSVRLGRTNMQEENFHDMIRGSDSEQSCRAHIRSVP